MLAKPRIFRHLCPRVSGCLVVSFVTLVCNISFVRAETIHATYAQPQIDRWMYPFNGTPGTRPTISTFGSTPGTPEFDSRDGQFVMAFATSPQVPSSLGSNHANWNQPDTRIGSVTAPNFNAGKIVGSTGGRIVQLGLRINF